LGGELCSDGYYGSTVGTHSNEEMIKQYIKEQGWSVEKEVRSLREV